MRTNGIGMMIGMTKAKIAVSLDAGLVPRLRAAVAAGRADSVSAFVEAAVEKHLSDVDLDVLLAQMLEETGGPPTAEEIEAADRLLGYVE